MNFLKVMSASCLGVFLAGIALFALVTMIGVSAASSSLIGNEEVEVKTNTVLKLSLGDVLPEHTGNVDPNSQSSFSTEKVIGLHDLIGGIRRAKEDDKIKGILIDMNRSGIGQASATALRDEILSFKESGKFVYAHAEAYTKGAYYIASAANKVYTTPLGGVEFTGFSTMIPFVKEMLDKLGVDMQVYYAGKFKSATEPYRNYSMSKESKIQTRAYLNTLYNIYLQDISETRGVPVDELRRIADEYLIRNADDAVKYKLTDGTKYWDEMLDLLRDDLGLDKKEKINALSLSEYAKDKGKVDLGIKDKIAVIYAEGGIVDGKGQNGGIGGDRYAKIIRKVRQDDKIKAVVLRINSGGGSGLASDIMWRELELTKAAGKPVIASMGDVAASGGYYIACNADTIYAEPNTITGSIGVFGMIPSIEGVLKDKVGITFDTVKTAKFANGISPFLDMSEEEGAIVQQSIDEFYEVFLKRVGEGRGMTRDEVHEVAQGRVWTGVKAKELKLVDAMGGLDEALATAADMAGLERYRISAYPKIKDPLTEMLEQFTEEGTDVAAQAVVDKKLKNIFPYYNYVEEVMLTKGVQARIPFLVPKLD